MKRRRSRDGGKKKSLDKALRHVERLSHHEWQGVVVLFMGEGGSIRGLNQFPTASNRNLLAVDEDTREALASSEASQVMQALTIASGPQKPTK